MKKEMVLSFHNRLITLNKTIEKQCAALTEDYCSNHEPN